MDLPQWMCNELALANRVVIVSNEAYKAKADGRQGGVGWETMIIQGDLLRTRYAFHAKPSEPPDSFREELVKELLDLPLDERVEAKECFL